MAIVEAVFFSLITDGVKPYSATFTENGEKLPFTGAKLAEDCEVLYGESVFPLDELLPGTHVALTYDSVQNTVSDKLMPEIILRRIAILNSFVQQ